MERRETRSDVNRPAVVIVRSSDRRISVRTFRITRNCNGFGVRVATGFGQEYIAWTTGPYLDDYNNTSFTVYFVRAQTFSGTIAAGLYDLETRQSDWFTMFVFLNVFYFYKIKNINVRLIIIIKIPFKMMVVNVCVRCIRARFSNNSRTDKIVGQYRWWIKIIHDVFNTRRTLAVSASECSFQLNIERFGGKCTKY